ncbi:MAG: right-handed parallel beta-helix repeat-containing protein [Desulfobacteraceae bacterium]
MTGKGKIQNATRGFAGLLLGICLVVCLVTAATTVSVQAAEYVFYVDGAGNDDLGTGSLGAPWRSIQKALTEISALNMSMADNLVINVGPGAYNVTNGEVNSQAIYEISTPNIAIKGAGGHDSIIDGSGMANWVMGLVINAANITITELGFSGFQSSGVTISGVENAKILNCAFMNNGYGIRVFGSTADISPEIVGNTIEGCMYNGLLVEANGSGSLSPMIKGNTISGSVSNGISLMVMSGTVIPRLYGNTIKDNGSYGIYMYVNMGTMSPFVGSNTISGNPTGIYIGCYSGIAAPVIRNNLIKEPHPTTHDYGIQISMPMSGSVTPEIIHNTLDGGGITSTGINIPYMNVFPEIRYNIITNFSQYGINNEQTGTLEIDYNNVYNNGVDYYNVDLTGTGNISEDPLYEYDFSIPVNSPCVDAIPVADEVSNLTVLVADDLIGTTRPRASAAGQGRNYDIGCYEFPYKEFTLKLPGGSGRLMDYKMMSMPLDMDEKLSPIEVFESVYGPYDPAQCRIFSYVNGTDPPLYTEINSESSGTEDGGYNDGTMSFEGSAFWVISRNTDALVFGGQLISNKRPFTVILSQGWNMVANPWADSSENDNIELGYITVSTMDSKHYLLELENTLTEQAVWTYSETGYRKLVNSEDTLDIGKSYWIYAQTDGVTLTIPPDNTGDFMAKSRAKGSKNAKNMTPPLPPGSGLTAEGGNGCFIGSTF